MREEMSAAQAGWAAGHWRPARESAKRILAESFSRREPDLHAQACLLLAQTLTLESKFALAAQFASRSRRYFAQQQEPQGLSESMLLTSYIESALGHDREAVAAAQGVAAGVQAMRKRPAAGLNYEAIAAIWRAEYGVAGQVLEAACQLAPQETGGSASAFHPLVNAILAEVFRCAELRMQGRVADFAPAEALVAQAWGLWRGGEWAGLASVSALPAAFLLSFATCFLASRARQSARADRYYLRCLQYASCLPPSSWMQSLLWWARLERTMAAHDLQEAAVSAQRMLLTALEGEHLPMRKLARQLAAEAHAHLGAEPSPHTTLF